MFTIRTSPPNQWNKLYNNYNNGGLSWCINGKPMNGISNVLANCVGWACSRFNEIYNEMTGYDGMMYRELCCNAEDFWWKAKELGLKRGQKPRAGAIMVWEGVGSAAGHVAIVERVNSNTEVYTSESGYDSAFFWNSTRYKADGNWGAGYGYRFLGFIYNPAIKMHKVKSRSFDLKKNKWLSAVISVEKPTDTTGNKKDPMGAITIKSGTLRKYCVKREGQKDFDKPVKEYGTKKGKYAGDKKTKIVAIAIDDKGLAFKAKLGKTQTWLPTVYGKDYNLKDIDKGYAGNGKDWIDEVKIWRIDN